ncbi:MAG: SDR family oxidoreductase [Novosphingobium sp.]|nr:SDR family oxidoreductase [Novosphingobium sp.]
MRGELEGKVAVVTGGAYGLGRAIAENLARRGARVALTDIHDRLDATHAELAAGFPCVAHRMDVTDRAEVGAVAARVKAEWGRVDILVNNAGYSRTVATILDMDMPEWDLSMRVNVNGALHCIQAFGGMMVEQGGGGRIVNIASTAAFRPYRFKSPYCVGKSALVALTRAAALELAEHRITVNAVAPGQTETETTLLLQADPRYGEGMKARAAAIPLGGMGKPEDIANAVAFFAHPDQGHVTGQVTLVDGGTLLV